MFSATAAAASIATIALAATLIIPRGVPGPGAFPAAGASPAPGTSDEHPEAVVVTAKQACPTGMHIVDGEYVADCTVTASDPQMSGTLALTLTGFDISRPNDAGAGVSMSPARLQGPEGTWSGPVYVVWDIPDGGPNDVMAVLTGDGAYESWTYVFAADLVGPEPSIDWESVGTLYQGAPPPPWDMPAAGE
jgi:hypothetical protein